MKPTTMTHPSGPELRRATAEAFGGRLFTHRTVREGISSLQADFVPTTPDNDNDMSPAAKGGTVAFKCTHCAAESTLAKAPKFCLKCGKPVVPVESASADDPRRVNESSGVVKKRVEASNLLQLRQAIGAKYPFTPKPSPLPASGIRADMEALAGRKLQTDRAERAALDALAKK